MHIWQIPYARFTGATEAERAVPEWEGDFALRAQELLEAEPAVPARSVNFGAGLKRTIRQVNYLNDLVALDVDGTPIGAFLGDDLVVAPAHRRRGVGGELLLRAWELRPWSLDGLTVPVGGRSVLASAYRMAVLRAADRGAPVPEAHVAAAQMTIRDTFKTIPLYRHLLAGCAAIAAMCAVAGFLLHHYVGIPLVLLLLFGPAFGLICARSASAHLGHIMAPAARFLTLAAFSLPGVAISLGSVISFLRGQPL